MSMSPAQNFSFLQEKLPELEKIASLAEQYANPDPDSCVAKLRMFIEKLLKQLAPVLKVEIRENCNLGEILIDSDLKDLLPKSILGKLHLLRKIGNKGIHSGSVVADEAKQALQDAQDVSGWIYISFFGGDSKSIPRFKDPEPEKGSQQIIEQFLEELAEKDAYIEELLAQQSPLVAQEQPAYGLDHEAIREKGAETAKALGFNEAETRSRLIDWELRNAGWNVGVDEQSTTEVGQEVQLQDQPTPTGSGRADYVLWDDDGKPLAVIEAKKTSVNPKIGRKQAELYADALEKQFGQRPIIFFTNGFETYLWNDAIPESVRRVYGFYSKDSLQYLVFQRAERKPLKDVEVNAEIAGRPYQIEAIKRVAERFQEGKRKALIVMATGTGKTRVSIALADVLMQNAWAKRILFLCDRRELRRQARDAFQEYTEASIVTVTRKTAGDREKRIYMATYPAMKKILSTFDVGFFDLIVADESHRSIYNTYRDIFLYFDALQVGLTATPVNFIHRNTFGLFDCGDRDPTAYFSYQDALTSEPPYLVPFEVIEHTTEFQRDGIRYQNMAEEQRAEIEEQLIDAEDTDYDARDLDSKIFNKDTNREILRNLMDRGIRDKNGTFPGKSIIFARNHKHAEVLEDCFNEMYKQFGSKFCQIIDNYNPRAEELIKDFKGDGNNQLLTIAISVDMLDTGIDVPEIVNLVFAKPVKSYVKFWQMIGRGTRLCNNLFGPGEHKEKFRIIDHWGNFRWFEENYKLVDPGRDRSLLERLFLKRIELATTALGKPDTAMLEIVTKLLKADVAALKETDTIAVKDNWREILIVADNGVIDRFGDETKRLLQNTIAPLMVWRNIFGTTAFYQFDLLIAGMQKSLLNGSADFADQRAALEIWLNRLILNLDAVRPHLQLIEELKKPDTWTEMTPQRLEEIRLQLRGIMDKVTRPTTEYTIPIVDVTEVREQIQSEEYLPKLPEMEMAAYRLRVEGVLTELFKTNTTLQKIRAAEPVSPQDVSELVSLVLLQHPGIDLRLLHQYFPHAKRLELAIRRIVGLAPEVVNEHFTSFIQLHKELTASQIKFLDMLKNHIVKHGGIEKEKLYDAPFTLLDSSGIVGVFDEELLINELFDIVDAINEVPA